MTVTYEQMRIDERFAGMECLCDWLRAHQRMVWFHLWRGIASFHLVALSGFLRRLDMDRRRLIFSWRVWCHTVDARREDPALLQLTLKALQRQLFQCRCARQIAYRRRVAGLVNALTSLEDYAEDKARRDAALRMQELVLIKPQWRHWCGWAAGRRYRMQLWVSAVRHIWRAHASVKLEDGFKRWLELIKLTQLLEVGVTLNQNRERGYPRGSNSHRYTAVGENRGEHASASSRAFRNQNTRWALPKSERQHP